MKKVFLAVVVIACLIFLAQQCRAEATNLLRGDFDDLGTTAWWVGEISVSEKLNWVADCIVYINQMRVEIDTGPKFSLFAGKFQINPTIGVEVDWLEDKGQFDIPFIIPSLFLFLSAGKWYGESWTQFFGPVSEGMSEFWYLRDFVYRRVIQREGWALGFGPQVEVNLLSGQDDVRYGGVAVLEVGKVTFMIFDGTDRGGNPTGRATVICTF